MLCRWSFALLYFIFWALCCLSFFVFRILITPLISSNSSYILLVDGQWTEWKADGPCSVTCGIGIQLLYRECSNPAPENGGQQCEGDRIKQIECNQQACCPSKNKMKGEKKRRKKK